MAETDDPGESGFIYTFSDIAKNLQIDKRTFKNWKWDLVKKKQGREYLFEKESLYKAISDNSFVINEGYRYLLRYTYDRLPEYLKIEQCAKMLGIIPRQFRRNYIDTNNYLRNVEILKNGSTVMIEKESFLKYLKYLEDLKDDYEPWFLTLTQCAKILGITPRQFKNNYFKNNKLKEQGVKILRIGSIIRINERTFLSYLEKSGIEYKIPEYLKIEQCAEMLGITPRQFKKDYISNKKLKSEGVKIRKFFDTYIEKESFLRFLEKIGR